MGPDTIKTCPISSRYLVVTHYMVDGAPQALVRYLNSADSNEVTYIGHPLEAGYSNHECSISKAGDVFINNNIKSVIKIPILCWAWDIILTVYWVFKYQRTYEICVAAGCVNVIAALILKRWGRVKTVIFYSIDFVPMRFRNIFLQYLYRMFDNIAFVMADVTWCLTDRMLEARKREVSSSRPTRIDVIVPIGIDRLVAPYAEKQIERYTLVYVGMVLEKQGLQIVIPALKPLQRKYPTLRLRIVGDGPFLHNIRRLAQDHGVEKLVEFCGLITDRAQLTERVGTAAIGLATYAPTSDSFTWYADPTKPKDYMALGIPVLITEVPEISKIIHAAGAGRLVSYDTQDVLYAIDRFLADDDCWRAARQSAFRLSYGYHWDAIFEQALMSSRPMAKDA